MPSRAGDPRPRPSRNSDYSRVVGVRLQIDDFNLLLEEAQTDPAFNGRISRAARYYLKAGMAAAGLGRSGPRSSRDLGYDEGLTQAHDDLRRELAILVSELRSR